MLGRLGRIGRTGGVNVGRTGGVRVGRTGGVRQREPALPLGKTGGWWLIVGL